MITFDDKDLNVWLVRGQRGISSNTIVQHLLGMPNLLTHAGHPYDPSDLLRCRLLLEAVPAMKSEFPRMASLSPEWKRLVENWQELCNIMDAEVPEWRNPYINANAPKTYAFMKAVLAGKATVAA